MCGALLQIAMIIGMEQPFKKRKTFDGSYWIYDHNYREKEETTKRHILPDDEALFREREKGDDMELVKNENKQIERNAWYCLIHTRFDQ